MDRYLTRAPVSGAAGRFLRRSCRSPAATLLAVATLVASPPLAPTTAADPPATPVAVEALVAEALLHNPEILAARHQQDAAARRATTC